jgi:RNA polymerase sigma-70 factor (ECF subfamily)
MFRRRFEYVWRCAYAVAGAEAADDVTQEAFMVARKRWASFEGGSERGWLYAIVRNVARNATRSRRRRQSHLAAVAVPAPMATPEDHVALRQAADLLDAFIATLSPAQRDAFVLMDMEGMTAPEVARIAGVPTRTVYSRLRAARRAFEAFTQTHDAGRAG